MLWQDKDIIEHDPEYAELYQSSKLFHKLQIARYTIMHKFGGAYSDFDIVWKIGFDDVYAMFDEKINVIFPKRNSLYFYNRGMKTILIDDFTIFSKPGILKEFLSYCRNRTDRKNDETEPFSVYALTEWLLTQNNTDFLTHKQIGQTEDCTVGVHANHKTWQNTN